MSKLQLNYNEEQSEDETELDDLFVQFIASQKNKKKSGIPPSVPPVAQPIAAPVAPPVTQPIVPEKDLMVSPIVPVKKTGRPAKTQEQKDAEILAKAHAKEQAKLNRKRTDKQQQATAAMRERLQAKRKEIEKVKIETREQLKHHKDELTAAAKRKLFKDDYEEKINKEVQKRLQNEYQKNKPVKEPVKEPVQHRQPQYIPIVKKPIFV